MLMMITRTLKKINRFRPETFVVGPGKVQTRGKYEASVGEDGSYTLDAGVYEVIFNEQWGGIMPPAMSMYGENGISFTHYVHDVDEETAALMTVGSGFLKIWPNTTIVEYFMPPSGDTVEKRGRGRPPKTETNEQE